MAPFEEEQTRTLHVKLNQSFFGIASEEQSKPAADRTPANPAQIHAGRILMEMLRALCDSHLPTASRTRKFQ